MPHANATLTLRLADTEVARIGLGTNRLTNTREHVAFVKEGVAAGGSHIDTAHSYTGGDSEKTMGAALSPHADEVIVATKGGYQAGQGRPEVLRGQIDQSLRRLQTDSISLNYLHRVDPQTPLDESVAAIKEYRDSGKIRHIGLSEVGIEQIERARAVVPIAAVQNQYNLSERRYEDAVDYCAREGIVFVPFFPLRGDGGRPLAEIAACSTACRPTCGTHSCSRWSGSSCLWLPPGPSWRASRRYTKGGCRRRRSCSQLTPRRCGGSVFRTQRRPIFTTSPSACWMGGSISSGCRISTTKPQGSSSCKSRASDASRPTAC